MCAKTTEDESRGYDFSETFDELSRTRGQKCWLLCHWELYLWSRIPLFSVTIFSFPFLWRVCLPASLHQASRIRSSFSNIDSGVCVSMHGSGAGSAARRVWFLTLGLSASARSFFKSSLVLDQAYCRGTVQRCKTRRIFKVSPLHCDKHIKSHTIGLLRKRSQCFSAGTVLNSFCGLLYILTEVEVPHPSAL